MKVMVIDEMEAAGFRLEIAVQDKDVTKVAALLESHPSVRKFYVDGMNVSNQQRTFGLGGFVKWSSPIQQ